MKNRGFTLLELLGVIVILALLTTLVFPSVLNAIKKSSDQTDKLSMDLISNAADLYIESHANDFKKRNGSKFIIDMTELIEDGNLPNNIKISDIEDINDKCIQVTYMNNDYSYELKNSGNCEMFLALPEEYQQVEYIKSTGTQWIVTGYIPTKDDEINIKNVTYEEKNNYQALFSSGTGDYQLIYLITRSSDSCHAYFKYFATGSAVEVTNTLDNFSNIFIRSNGEIYFNDEMVGQSTYGNEINEPLYLFIRANNTSFATATMGRFTIKNNGETKLDLIPCYHKTTLEVGMYDLVEDKFYTNSGTGIFENGQDI